MAQAPKPPANTGKNDKTAKATGAKDDKKESKPRAPRVDYGYAPSSIIQVTKYAKDKEPKFHGKRLQYWELLKKFNGKTVNDFEGAAPKDDPPRGWLRFFCQNGNCTLKRVKPAKGEEAKK